MECIREMVTGPDIVYLSREGKWNFLGRFGAWLCLWPYISNTTVLQICDLQNNESVVKPQENPSIHPSVIPTQGHRVARVYPSSHWVRSRNPSLHVLFFFGCLGLTDYTTVTHSSPHCTCNVSVWVCLFQITPQSWIKHYREIFILVVL